MFSCVAFPNNVVHIGRCFRASVRFDNSISAWSVGEGSSCIHEKFYLVFSGRHSASSRTFSRAGTIWGTSSSRTFSQRVTGALEEVRPLPVARMGRAARVCSVFSIFGQFNSYSSGSVVPRTTGHRFSFRRSENSTFSPSGQQQSIKSVLLLHIRRGPISAFYYYLSLSAFYYYYISAILIKYVRCNICGLRI